MSQFYLKSLVVCLLCQFLLRDKCQSTKIAGLATWSRFFCFRCLVTILSTVLYVLCAWSSPCYLSQPGTHSLYVTTYPWGKTERCSGTKTEFLCLIKLMHHWSKFLSAWLQFWAFDPCDMYYSAAWYRVMLLPKLGSIFPFSQIRGDSLISILHCCPEFSEVLSQFYQAAKTGRLFTTQTNQAAMLDFLT